jgi:hypothetical protein
MRWPIPKHLLHPYGLLRSEFQGALHQLLNLPNVPAGLHNSAGGVLVFAEQQMPDFM